MDRRAGMKRVLFAAQIPVVLMLVSDPTVDVVYHMVTSAEMKYCQNAAAEIVILVYASKLNTQ